MSTQHRFGFRLKQALLLVLAVEQRKVLCKVGGHLEKAFGSEPSQAFSDIRGSERPDSFAVYFCLSASATSQVAGKPI